MLVRLAPPTSRTDTLLLRQFCRARAAMCWARWAGLERLESTQADERGLTTAEYVVLGAFVVVAAAVIGTALYSFLQSRAGIITNTPTPAGSGS